MPPHFTPSILLVDDDPGLTKLLSVILEPMGFDVQVAHDGSSALSSLSQGAPDLLILDLMLPDIDGREVCRKVREKSTVPIIALTCLQDSEHRVGLLDTGADDYVTKPFRSAELLARIQAQLRRARPEGMLNIGSTIRVDELEIDLAHRRVTIRGREIHLSPLEYRLLCRLAAYPGEVQTHQMLLGDVWGDPGMGASAYLHVHIGRLRRKIEINPAKPTYILTVHGIGYKMREA
jgi:DNA-binding response OmpR family regulator